MKRAGPGNRKSNIGWSSSSNNSWSKYYSWTFQLRVLILFFFFLHQLIWIALLPYTTWKIPGTSVYPCFSSSNNPYTWVTPASWPWFPGPWTFSQYLWHKQGILLSNMHSVLFSPTCWSNIFKIYPQTENAEMQYHYVYRGGKHNIELSLQVSFSDAGDTSLIPKLWVEVVKVVKRMLRRTGYWMWFNR